MRILSTNFHRGWGGQPTRVLMQARSITDQGHEVIVAAPRGSMLAERARAAGLPTFEEAAFKKTKHLGSAFADALRLSGQLRSGGYHLIDSHGSQDLWTCVAARAISRMSLPLLYTRHNTKAVAPHAANRWLYRAQVDHLIVVSRTILDRYAPFLKRGDLRPDRISIVHSAYRRDRFHLGLDGGRVRAELGLPPGVPIVGVIGRLVRDKGQDDLLRAAAMILQRRPETVFLLVGTGTSEGDLRALASSLGVAHAIRFLGFRDDVPQITAALTVSVLPSVDCDASSSVLKEAPACGIPVVATDIGGAREIVRHGETGYVVPPRDPPRLAEAILDLLSDPAKAAAMGRRGSLEIPARFGPDRLAEETLAVFRAVLARWPDRRAAS